MPRKLMKKVKKYTKILIEKSERRIEDITIIGSLVNGNFKQSSDIDLVICFEPDFTEDWRGNNEGYRTVRSLVCKLADAQKKLGINHFIDLGWIAECGDIFLSGGLISHYHGKHITFTREDLENS